MCLQIIKHWVQFSVHINNHFDIYNWADSDAGKSRQTAVVENQHGNDYVRITFGKLLIDAVFIQNCFVLPPLQFPDTLMAMQDLSKMLRR